jgi:hypothetical protein
MHAPDGLLVSTTNDCPRSEEEWSSEIGQLMRLDGSPALARRNRLAACDTAKMAHLLADLLADERADTRSRMKAAWLLKDLSEPTVASKLDLAARSADCPEQLRELILDTLERMSFGTPDLKVDLDRLSAVVRGPGERRHFVGLLTNIGNAEAQKLLAVSLARENELPTVLDLSGRLRPNGSIRSWNQLSREQIPMASSPPLSKPDAIVSCRPA